MTDNFITLNNSQVFNMTDNFITLYNSWVYTPNPSDTNFTHNTTSPNDVKATSSSMTSASEEEGLEQWIASGIDFWVPPILFFSGIIANILVIMVMRSQHFRHMSTSFYMTVGAVVDNISLLLPLPAHYLYVNFPHIFDNARDGHVMCSFFHFFGWASSNLGVFLTVAMTVDRSLAIQFPLKAVTLCTVKRARIVTVCLFLLEVLKEGHLAFSTRVATKEVTAHLCDVDKNISEVYATFHDHYWPYINNIFLFLAFITIVIGNIIIILHVKRSESSKDMGKGAKSSGGSQPGMTSSRSRQLSLMLIIDSVSVIICTQPFSIYILLDQSYQLFDDTPQGRGKHNLVFAITFYLLYVNRCANFFLYCLSGARFRQTLKEILTRKSIRLKRKNSIMRISTIRNGCSSTFSMEEGGNKVNASQNGTFNRARAWVVA